MLSRFRLCFQFSVFLCSLLSVRDGSRICRMVHYCNCECGCPVRAVVVVISVVSEASRLKRRFIPFSCSLCLGPQRPRTPRRYPGVGATAALAQRRFRMAWSDAFEWHGPTLVFVGFPNGMVRRFLLTAWSDAFVSPTLISARVAPMFDPLHVRSVVLFLLVPTTSLSPLCFALPSVPLLAFLISMPCLASTHLPSPIRSVQ